MSSNSVTDSKKNCIFDPHTQNAVSLSKSLLESSGLRDPEKICDALIDFFQNCFESNRDWATKGLEIANEKISYSKNPDTFIEEIGILFKQALPPLPQHSEQQTLLKKLLLIPSTQPTWSVTLKQGSYESNVSLPISNWLNIPFFSKLFTNGFTESFMTANIQLPLGMPFKAFQSYFELLVHPEKLSSKKDAELVVCLAVSDYFLDEGMGNRIKEILLTKAFKSMLYINIEDFPENLVACEEGVLISPLPEFLTSLLSLKISPSIDETCKLLANFPEWTSYTGTLDLSDNRIDNWSLSKIVELFPQISSLKLFRTQVNALPSFKSLPNLKELVLCNSSIIEIPAYKNLEIFHALHCPDLKNLNRLDNSDHLKEIYLLDCPSINSPPSHCKGIESFKAHYCESLVSLERLNSEQLRTIELGNCSNVARIPNRFENLEQFKATECLSLRGSITLDHSTKLKVIEIDNCSYISQISYHCNTLESLKVSHCSSLASLFTLGTPEHLKEIHLNNCPLIQNIPPHHYPDLEDFSAHHCASLNTLDPLDDSEKLKTIRLDSCPLITRAPRCKNLESFEAFRCSTLSDLTSLEDSTLKKIHLHICPLITKVPQRCKNLESFEADDCAYLDDLTGLNDLMFLKLIDLVDCPRVSKAPSGCGNLENFNASGCEGLSDISELDWNFVELDIQYCPLITTSKKRRIDRD